MVVLVLDQKGSLILMSNKNSEDPQLAQTCDLDFSPKHQNIINMWM